MYVEISCKLRIDRRNRYSNRLWTVGLKDEKSVVLRQCIYLFRMNITVTNDNFLIQLQSVSICSVDCVIVCDVETEHFNITWAL
jgi:hypothetical protein